jgi:cell division protein FtsL
MFFVGKRDQNLGIRKRTVDKRVYLGPNSMKVIILVILAAFSLFYLSQSSQSATKNYQISDLDQQKNDINSEKERLEVEANRLKALSIIQEKASQNGMEQVSE